MGIRRVVATLVIGLSAGIAGAQESLPARTVGVVKDATGHLSAGLVGAALVEAVAAALVLAAPSLRNAAAAPREALAN